MPTDPADRYWNLALRVDLTREDVRLRERLVRQERERLRDLGDPNPHYGRLLAHAWLALAEHAREIREHAARNDFELEVETAKAMLSGPSRGRRSGRTTGRPAKSEPGRAGTSPCPRCGATPRPGAEFAAHRRSCRP